MKCWLGGWVILICGRRMGCCMALKPSSDIFTIGAEIQESSVNTFTEHKIDIQLNPLDNEVLAIYAVDLQLVAPECITATDTEVAAALYTTSSTSLPTIDEAKTIATANAAIRMGGPGEAAVFNNRSLPDTPTADGIDYIGLVATSDMYLAVDGNNNTSAKRARVKVWARRMRADAATYAALVQSELLSN